MKSKIKIWLYGFTLLILTVWITGVINLLLLASVVSAAGSSSPFSSIVGVSYGRLFGSAPLPPAEAMRQVKRSFDLVRFFDVDQNVMNEAVANGLEIILTVPNARLTELNSVEEAESYVVTNISPWQDHIKAIIAGIEIFLNDVDSNPSEIVPRMQNLNTALKNNNINHIPVTTNINLSVLANSFPVNESIFKNELRSELDTIFQYTESSPGFVFINIYPWYAIQDNPEVISLEYATFEGPGVNCFSDSNDQCQNLFQAQYLAWNFAVQELLPGNITVAYIGETGWPSAGGVHPNLSTAENEGTYVNGYVKWVKAQTSAIPSLLFEMYNEPNKPNGSQELHWGLFYEDGTPKIQLEPSLSHDSFLQRVQPHDNEGANEVLSVSQDNNTVVGFDLSTEPIGELESARLILTLRTPISGQGSIGEMVQVRRLQDNFAEEGNGVQSNLGMGVGVTWACSEGSIR